MHISRLFLRNAAVALGLVLFASALVTNNPTLSNDFLYAAILALVATIALHIWLTLKPWR